MISSQQFLTIREEAERMGMPRGFERAILHEYLQCQIVYLLSELRGSEKMALIGGTGLRLLYNLDRFSEDLDFDLCGLSPTAAASLLSKLAAKIKEKGYSINFKTKSSGTERGGKLTFHNLLYDLKISRHPDENLMVKIEYTSPRPIPQTSAALLNRFGFTTQVTSEPLSALCARKLLALRQRQHLQPRDLYDLTWLFSRRVIPDKKTLKNFGVRSLTDFKRDLLRLLESHKPKMAQYERDLAPLVLNPDGISSIRLVADQIREILV